MNHTTSLRNPTEQRALDLLGSGYAPEIVANSCGVTVSRISQLLADPIFKEDVASLRVAHLQKHNLRDAAYDSLEDSLLEKLKVSSSLLFRPMEIAKVLQLINAAKRRGTSAPEAITAQQTVVSITMPTQIVQRFTTNVNNQVVSAGSQDLLTIQSHELKSMASRAAASATDVAASKGLGNENDTGRDGGLANSTNGSPEKAGGAE